MTMPMKSVVSQMDNASFHWNESERYQHVGDLQEYSVVNRVPWFFRFDRAPIEATGLSIDMYTRATIVMSSLFLGPALLELASDQVKGECQQFSEDSEHYGACLDEVRIYGFKPSSLLSNIAVAGGILGAFILPPFGAIVDRTPYRKQVGMYSAVLITVVKPIELMIGPDTWFVIAWLQIFTAVLFCIHISSIFAYMSELSDDPHQQTNYNTYYFVIMYVSTLVFMIETLGIALLFNTGSVGTAKIALGITTINCVFGFTFTWKYLFRDRPALTVVDDGGSIILSGFGSLFTSFARINRKLPALRWLMLAILFGEGANSAVVTIGTTFMVHFLEMDGKDVGIVFLVILIMGPMGSQLGGFIALRTNPVTSAKVCLCTFIVTQTLAAVILTGPERSQYTVIFGIFWGLCLGWLHPVFITAFITIRPSGMDAQMMSFFLFCGSGFTWLPPLVFSICNEYGLHIMWSMMSLDIFFFLGILCLLAVGDYREAMQATRSSESENNPVGEGKSTHMAVPVTDDGEKNRQNIQLPSIS